MNTAIIVGAGSGTRIGSDKPKQFLEIHGKPIITHTLERFASCDAVDEIILVLPEADIEIFKQTADFFSINKISQVVAGGRTRAESVWNGLNFVSESIEIVAVHDGARPLVSADEISRTIGAAIKNGAACLVAPVTDTIKEVTDEEIIGTIDRSQLRRALTPQAFRAEILKKAFENTDLSESITDECYLVEKLGLKITCVEGSPRNIKVTHAEDLILAELFLKNECIE
jgi:2-C-methyl-D-erythritol 4-phosphate cytidylyltransferase